jgi:hypothetical protein
MLAGPETEMELKVGLLEPPPLLLEPPPQPTNSNVKISAIDNGARCARMKELLALEIGVVY